VLFQAEKVPQHWVWRQSAWKLDTVRHSTAAELLCCVTNKPFMVNVVMLSVVAPLKRQQFLIWTVFIKMSKLRVMIFSVIFYGNFDLKKIRKVIQKVHYRHRMQSNCKRTLVDTNRSTYSRRICTKIQKHYNYLQISKTESIYKSKSKCPTWWPGVRVCIIKVEEW
jgi:hypothetical protein